LAHADRGEHEAGTLQRPAWVGLRADLERRAPVLAEVGAEGGDELEPFRVGVVEDHLGEAELLRGRREPVEDERRPNPRAEERHLHEAAPEVKAARSPSNARARGTPPREGTRRS